MNLKPIHMPGRYLAGLLMLVLWAGLSASMQGAELGKAGKIYSLQEILDQWKPKPLADAVAAAETGDVTAQHFLGYFHTEGLGGTTNYVEGRKWYLKAAEQNFPNSLNNLALIYRDGKGVEKDIEQTKTYLRRAAELGLTRAQEGLARLILYQKDPPDDEEREEAMKWFKIASDSGLGGAQIGYGYALMYPRTGGKREAAKAVEVLKLAVANGRKDANRWLGDIYFDKRFSGNNAATAIQYYRTGAEQGDASCQASLGATYFDGRGVEPNLERAVEWLLKAAEQKNTTAYYHLGRVYSGEETDKVPPGFRPDFEKAIEWFQKAAADGHVNSGYLRGKIIHEGMIPWMEKSEAMPIFETAAKAGHVWAQDRVLDFKAQQAAGRKNEGELLEDLALQGGTVAFMHLADRYRGTDAARLDPPRLFRYEAGGEMYGASGISSVLAHLKGRFPMTGSPKRKVVEADYRAIETALRQNDAVYFRQLAQRYVEGTAKDPIEACIWLRVAARYGHATAAREASALEAALDEKQKARIQGWVRIILIYQGQGFNR